jgi:hypothetical protein
MNAARPATENGWLSEHALRSGLTEQFATDVAGMTVVVELKWVRHHDNFHVSSTMGGSAVESASYTSIADARDRFIRCVERTRSIPGRKRS